MKDGIRPRTGFEAIPPGCVLGLNYSGMHDTSIALVSPEGEVLFACALERLSRIKQDGRPPLELLEGVPWENISVVAISTEREYLPPERPVSRLHPVLLSVPRKTGLVHEDAFHEYLNRLPVPREYVCHQRCHASSAFWPSRFDRALCLTYDGGMANCAWFGGLYEADAKTGLSPLDRFAASHHAKISTLYTSVTALLGFTPNKHEGKITGLAAYGRPSERCRAVLNRLFCERYFELEELAEWFFLYDQEMSPLLVVDQARRELLMGELSDISREDIAATVQTMAEDHVLAILGNARAQGWSAENICLSGGLFANVKINQRVKEWGFNGVFVSPPMTDDGTALGAALDVASRGERFRRAPVRQVFWGCGFDLGQIEQTLRRWELKYEKVDSAATRLAEELAHGSVLAVFQGRMEFGPRALGNRSILSQAGDPKINQELNARLLRTEFMPFAPITRMEDAAECYSGLSGAEHAAEFMTITTACTETMRARCPAVVHVDGTARPQLVSREQHPLLHEVLTAYRRISGNPALINTSFNVHEEPIVCSPDDAVEGFLESGLDFLYFEGGYLVAFADNRGKALEHLQCKRGEMSRDAQAMRQIAQELFRRLRDKRDEEERKEREIARVHETAEERLMALKQTTEEKDRQILGLQRVCEERLALIHELHAANALIRKLSIFRHKTRNALVRPFRRLGLGHPFRNVFRECFRIAPQHPPVPIRTERYPEQGVHDCDLPRISIVTPSFMQCRFLEHTIQSVLSQCYPCLEYVVQDGGSTDGTLELLKRYDSRAVRWRSARDGGQADAVARGFEGSTGEVMAWLNSDDLFLPGALGYVGGYFARHPEVDVIYGHRVLIDGEGLEVGRWVLPRHCGRDLRWVDYVPQETLFWRRSVWERVNGIDTGFHFALDWDLLLRFQNAGARIRRVPYFLACFRTHPEQKTSRYLDAAGASEMARIRRREHGREVDQRECDRASDRIKLRSYFTARLLEMGVRW
jgi:carbamoyltransferase